MTELLVGLAAGALIGGGVGYGLGWVEGFRSGLVKQALAAVRRAMIDEASKFK